jgi:hypothetical protein
LEATGAAVSALKPELLSFSITPEHVASEETARPLLAEIKERCGARPCLYVFRLSEAEAERLSLDHVQDRFASAKDSGVGLAFCKLNLVDPSPVLYVGSSLSLSARTRQHLGFGPDDTYALRLARWLSECSLDLVVAAFDHSASRDAVLYLEETLWHDLKPMFGRPGSAR